jgi:hypothetical protein
MHSCPYNIDAFNSRSSSAAAHFEFSDGDGSDEHWAIDLADDLDIKGESCQCQPM